MTLGEAKVKSTVIVSKIEGDKAYKRRIMDMGITKGTELYIRKVAPLGDPVEITVRGYELSLRKDRCRLCTCRTEVSLAKRRMDNMTLRIALAGNPNCGKTTMFNQLTGANQYVGNWPGVTVEKKEGKWKKNKDVTVTDLPGIYSLSPYTLEEVVSRDYLLHERPDVIIDLVDATNIERNLYLTTQLMETGIPVVIALNMADLLDKRHIRIDSVQLEQLLDCPVVETSALKGSGLDELMKTAQRVAHRKNIQPLEIFSEKLEQAIANVKKILPPSLAEETKRWYAIKCLEDDDKIKITLSKDNEEQLRQEKRKA